MLKPTVLIVDDEKPTREGLRAALEDRYDVYIAEDGEGACGCWRRTVMTCYSLTYACRALEGST